MKKIILANNTCLYLDHSKLIERSYGPYPDGHLYGLKPELFNFKPKNVNLTVVKGGNTNKRKRKTDAGNEETLKAETMLVPFLKEFQILVQTKKYCDLEDIPRVWEEEAEFPNFFGANPTQNFQRTQFGNRSYIIPPKCKFYNRNIEELSTLLPELEKYDIIIMDMPWQNKYIKRLKRVKTTLAYQMLDNDSLKRIPLQQLIHSRSLVVLWCTNALQHQYAIQHEFLPQWNLKLVHTLKWFKINTEGNLINPLRAEGHKQPYEMLFIACHKDRNTNELKDLQNIDFLTSVPSIIHSHKPPLVDWLSEFLDDPRNFKGLELFARYLQPHFTSIGLEVLKLMDNRLYISENDPITT